MTTNRTKQKYIIRLSELIEEGKNIRVKSRQKWTGGNMLTGENRYRTEHYLNYEMFVEWKTSCITILDAIVPISSIHRKSVEKFQSLPNTLSSQKYGVSFLKSILNDFENGFFESLESKVDADISSDYLNQAEQLLSFGKSENKSHIAAAVLSGSVLEHGLRSIANKLDPPEDKDSKGKPLMLGGLIEALKKRQVYNELTAKQLRHWGDIRNAAAHGKFDEFDFTQTESMINGISDFLVRYQE